MRRQPWQTRPGWWPGAGSGRIRVSGSTEVATEGRGLRMADGRLRGAAEVEGGREPGELVRARVDLLGREREMATLASAVGEVVAGESRLFLISGEAGIGKTRLVEAIAALARSRGVRVLTGRCWEAVDTPAYWPWIQVLRELVRDLPEAALREFVGSDEGKVISLLPGISRHLDPPPSGKEDGEVDRFALFDGTAALLRKASDAQPLVVALDDLHAADEPSLSLLQFLSQGNRSGSSLFLGTYDDHDLLTRPGSLQLVNEIGRHGHVLPLRGLDETEVEVMYRALSQGEPAPEIVRAIHQATEGNPFFTAEIIRMLNATGELQRPDQSTGFRVPTGIEGLLNRRLEALSPPAREVLQIASVIGREFNLSVLQSVAQLDLDPLLDLLGEALARDVIREDSALGRYSFSHILVRETLYQGIGSAIRMKTHRRVAETLEDAYRHEIEEHLQELAHHWFKAAQAGDAAKTLRFAKRAAEDAMSRAAYEEAARLYHRAVKVAETTGVPKAEFRALKEGLSLAQRAGATIEAASGASDKNVFACRGDYWVITFSGTTTHLKDLRGLSYLSHLLQNPGREIHALDLVQLVEGRSGSHTPSIGPDELPSEDRGAGEDVLDPTARTQYRRRLVELQEDIEEARENNDLERLARVEAEADALARELGASLGLGGRSRKTAGPSERARISVTKAIREAVKRIAGRDPALGRHLRATLRTGIFCCYTPDERFPAQWDSQG
jgi:predicted ATPase